MSNYLIPTRNGSMLSLRARSAVRQLDDQTAFEAAEMERASRLRRWGIQLDETDTREAMRSVEDLGEEAIRRGQRNPALAAFFTEAAARHATRSLDRIDRQNQPRP